MVIVEIIIILAIILNIPYIIAFIIGFVWGLIEVAVEGMNEGTAENNVDQACDTFFPKSTEPIFFAGCETPEDFKKRYRALMKIYHPDGAGGDAEVAKQINIEYDIAHKLL